jgi:glutaredoxin
LEGPVPTVTLLTKTDCDLCEHAKAVLERLAREIPLRVDVVDVASPIGQRLATEAGMAFPPTVLLDGQPVSYGRLSERKLRRALATAPRPTPPSR